MGWLDDPIIGQAPQQPAPAAPAWGANDPVIGPALAQEPSFSQGMFRSAGQGLSFGFGDEIEAKSRQYLYGEDYEAALADARAKLEKFREAEPYWAYGTEIASGLVVPGGVARTALRGGMTAANVARGAATVGAPSGALYGVGAAEGIKTPGEYAGAAAEGAAWGAGGYAVAAPVVHGIVRGATAVNRAVGDYINPAGAADRKFAGALNDAGVDGGALRDQVVPQPSSNLAQRGIGQQDIAEMVAAHREGVPAAQIAGQYGIVPATLRRYIDQYEAMNPAPANLVDLTKRVTADQGRTGADVGVTNLVRTAASLSPDEELANAAARLRQRQRDQGGRSQGHVARAVGGEEYEATRTQMLDDLRREMNTSYTAFYAEPGLPSTVFDDLRVDPVFQAAEQMARRRLALRLNEATGQTGVAPPLGPRPQPGTGVADLHSPEGLDVIQRVLRQAGDGQGPDAALARDLRRELLDRIEAYYPTFAPIRARYAEGRAAKDAIDAGAAMVTKLGGRMTESLREFRAATPAQQALYRIGFAESLMNAVANRTDGAAAVAQFQNDSTRRIIREMFAGHVNLPAVERRALTAAGERLIRDLQQEAVSTDTMREIFHILRGNITAGAQNDTAKFMEGATVAGKAVTGRLMGAVEAVSDQFIAGIGRRQASEILRLGTETDPRILLPALDRIIAQQGRLRAGQDARATAGQLGGIFAAEELSSGRSMGGD